MSMFGAKCLMGEKSIRSTALSNLPVAAYSRPIMSPDDRPVLSLVIATPYRISSLSPHTVTREISVREARPILTSTQFLPRDITIPHPPILEITRLGPMLEGLIEVNHSQSMIGAVTNLLSPTLDASNIRGGDIFLVSTRSFLTNDVGFTQYGERRYPRAPDHV